MVWSGETLLRQASRTAASVPSTTSPAGSLLPGRPSGEEPCPDQSARARDQLCALDDLAGRPEARGRRDREPRPQVWRRQPGALADGPRGANPCTP